MRYLLDSNTLIEAKNRYYSMAICPAYWTFIDKKNDENMIASISLVQDELKRGNDELANWAKENAKLFLSIDDDATQNAYTSIAGYVASKISEMKPGALDDFLSGADPWLIAKAMTSGATIVTHEAYNPAAKKKFLIPNVCKEFGVLFVDTFELLHKLEAEFILAA